MFQDPALSRRFYDACFGELRKTAEKIPLPKHVPHVTKRDLKAMAAGAAALAGGKRLIEDVKAGEELRKQQRQQGY